MFGKGEEGRKEGKKEERKGGRERKKREERKKESIEEKKYYLALPITRLMADTFVTRQVSNRKA